LFIGIVWWQIRAKIENGCNIKDQKNVQNLKRFDMRIFIDVTSTSLGNFKSGFLLDG